ncbi:MAG: GNAT family N-acetyltransferase [Acidobacteria bacterium]|nr:GNAT family N-acetyltransferase [Acidobacteriota bacterium]
MPARPQTGPPILPSSFSIGGEKPLQYAYATKRDERAFRSWVKSAETSSNPNVLDALELTTQAFRRWREEKAKGNLAESIEDIKDFIQDNPHAEVGQLVLARATWLKNGTLVGLCHFHRTWSNNIFIDFLAMHPRLVRKRTMPARGVGSALLYYVACVAAEIDAGAIWGETTQNSAPFYRRAFNRQDLKDMIYLNREEYMAFKTRIEERLRPAPQPVAEPEAARKGES